MISRKNNLPAIENQGTVKKCVASAFAALGFEHGEIVNSDILYERAKNLDRIKGNENVDEGTNLLGGRLALDALTTNIDILGIPATIASIDRALQESCVVFNAETKLFAGDRVGYHAAVICGADSSQYLIRNSWGVQYGNGGYKWMPKDHVVHHCVGNIYMARKKNTKSDSRKKKLVLMGVGIAVAVATRGADIIKLLLSNLGTIGNNLAQLRGLYGTGHGMEGNAKGLTPRHAKLAVGAASTLVNFLYETHKETLS